MAFEVLMPQLGLTMEEGTLTRWAVQEGDPVKKGDLLFEVTTDKLTNEVRSEVDGVLLKRLAREGDDYPVKAVLAYIGAAGETLAEPAAAGQAAEAAPQPAASDGDQQRTVLVVGGGPGGYVAAIRAAQLGAKVILVEKAQLGGTCLNRGCMPTKALLHSSECYHTATHSQDIGVFADAVRFDWAKVQANRAAVVKKLTDGVRALVKANRIELIEGEARFADSRSLRVGTQLLTADRIIIASGGLPAVPPIPGADGPACIGSTECLALSQVPESLVIVGGGVIGVELGSVYARFGSKVTVVEMTSHLLPLMDRELSSLLRKKLEAEGLRILTDTRVNTIQSTDEGALVRVSGPDGEGALEAEKVLLCTGRRPDTDSLRLDLAGIHTENGFITVNDRQETNVPGVYAVGDCTGKLMLAHAAMAMGETAAENAMGHLRRFRAEQCPACAYVGPELAGVGYTEEQAKALGIDYKVGRFPTAANGKSLVLGCTDGLVKVLAGRRYGEILGVHILAPNATELIGQAALAITLEATLDELGGMVYAHPSVSEAIHEAALAADKHAVHIPNK